MRKIAFLVAMLLMAVLRANAAGDGSTLWQQAGTYYQQKQYDSAAARYEQLIAAKTQDAAVYYNLGNCYYRLNKIGAAVLNYERALKRAPGNEDAKDNLLLTQNRIANRIQPQQELFAIRWIASLTHEGKAELWAWLSLAFFLIIVGLLAYRSYKGGSSIAISRVTGFTTAFFLIALTLAFVAADNANKNRLAVVMEDNAPLLVQAATTSKTIILIPEGTTVEREETAAGWVKVQLPDGRKGWMEQDFLAVVD